MTRSHLSQPDLVYPLAIAPCARGSVVFSMTWPHLSQPDLVYRLAIANYGLFMFQVGGMCDQPHYGSQKGR